MLTAMVPAVVLGSRPSRAADQPSKLKGLSGSPESTMQAAHALKQAPAARIPTDLSHAVEQVMELKRKELLDENSFVTGKVNRAIHTDDLAFGDPGVQQASTLHAVSPASRRDGGLTGPCCCR